MKTFFGIFFVATVAAFFATPWARRLAKRLGALDIPSERKVHSRVTPRLGGVAVFFGFCMPLVAFYLIENRVTTIFLNYETPTFALLGAGLMMLALGIYDDCKGADARKKFTVQIIAATFLYYFGNFRIDILSNPFGAPIQLGWFSLPISILWIVMITNAINLLDGIDGLVAGVTGTIALSLGIINVIYGNIFISVLTFCLSGACFGFLPHNFAPARIFLGDSGSLFIGITLAGISMYSLFKERTATLLLVPVFIFGLPLFDTVSVMIGRLISGKPLFEADKTHIHHRLLELGLTVRQAAFFLYALTALLSALSIASILDNEALQAGAAFCLVLATGWLVWKMRVARQKRWSPSNKPSNNS
jgi:UDP-GlcNAc:undecaprenyl-phosphate/decaprenyl-phosphate GlcNAc-1-phosphate transferase